MKNVYIQRLDLEVSYNDACSLSDYHERTGSIDIFEEQEFDEIMNEFNIEQGSNESIYHTDNI